MKEKMLMESSEGFWLAPETRKAVEEELHQALWRSVLCCVRLRDAVVADPGKTKAMDAVVFSVQHIGGVDFCWLDSPDASEPDAGHLIGLHTAAAGSVLVPGTLQACIVARAHHKQISRRAVKEYNRAGVRWVDAGMEHLLASLQIHRARAVLTATGGVGQFPLGQVYNIRSALDCAARHVGLDPA